MHYPYKRPLAITMWDFSWLERRWPGAGYEDWDKVLDELKERGYDAVRIDAYPHLLARDGEGEWLLKPEWSQQAWGAPAMITLRQLKKNLLEFIGLCRSKEIAVALSTWFREDVGNTRLTIETPLDLAAVWKTTLDTIRAAGLLDSILYVDICNEYPFKEWTQFLMKAAGQESIPRFAPESIRWMRETLEELRIYYPDMDYTFSEADTSMETLKKSETEFLDFNEIHIWFTQFTDFYEKVGYHYDRFVPDSFNNLVEKGENYYLSKPEFFQEELKKGIAAIAQWSAEHNRTLITTECWGPVDYKDWPGLDWGWVKELCETGVIAAVGTGRWAAIATSNFCGPQFRGMWRDTAWHKKLTDRIHSGKLPGHR